MFTGIVEEVGRVEAIEDGADSCRITVAAGLVLERMRTGDSVAIEGVCQTVVALDEERFSVQAIATTLSRTTLGGLRPGDPVNLERPLALGDRLGGHVVQGHVDGVGTVRAVTPAEGHVLFDVAMPEVVAEVTVLHGSIAIGGVSLTVNALPEPNVAQVALIPYTWEHTTLRHRRAGDGVNLEADLFGKFVVHYMKRREAGGV